MQHRLITSHVDAFEEEEDRLVVRFATVVGSYWVSREDEELVAALRQSLQTGLAVEVTVEDQGKRITDVISRQPRAVPTEGEIVRTSWLWPHGDGRSKS